MLLIILSSFLLFINWIFSLYSFGSYIRLCCALNVHREYRKTSTEVSSEDPRNQDTKEDPLTEYPKEDPTTEDPKEDTITEDPRGDPINENPKEDLINEAPKRGTYH